MSDLPGEPASISPAPADDPERLLMLLEVPHDEHLVAEGYSRLIVAMLRHARDAQVISENVAALRPRWRRREKS